MEKSKYIKLIGVFYAFLIFGFIDNIKGAILPDFLGYFNLNYSDGSNFIAFNLFGYMLGTLITGYISKGCGKNKLVSLSAAFMTIGIICFTSFQNYKLIVFFFFVLGIGFGMIQVTANSLIVELFQERKGKYLNLLTFFNGFGAIIAPVYVSHLIAQNFKWQGIYRLVLILPIILFIYFIIVTVLFDKQSSIIVFDKDAKKQLIEKKKVDILFFAFILFFYIAAEIGFSSWIVEFLTQTKRFTIGKSTFYLSLFFLLLSLGRLFGSLFVEKMAYIKILFFAAIAAAVLLFLGIFLPPSFAILLPMVGFCFSVIFPTTIALATQRYKENNSDILSVLFFSGSIGGMAGPWLIGKVSYGMNLTRGLAMTGVFCILIIVALLLLQVYDLKKVS